VIVYRGHSFHFDYFLLRTSSGLDFLQSPVFKFLTSGFKFLTSGFTVDQLALVQIPASGSLLLAHVQIPASGFLLLAHVQVSFSGSLLLAHVQIPASGFLLLAHVQVSWFLSSLLTLDFFANIKEFHFSSNFRDDCQHNIQS
jgi:hypothetical protein